MGTISEVVPIIIVEARKNSQRIIDKDNDIVQISNFGLYNLLA